MDPAQDKWTSKFSKKADAYLTLEKERQIKEIEERFLLGSVNHSKYVLKFLIVVTVIQPQNG